MHSSHLFYENPLCVNKKKEFFCSLCLSHDNHCRKERILSILFLCICCLLNYYKYVCACVFFFLLVYVYVSNDEITLGIFFFLYKTELQYNEKKNEI